MKFNEHFKVQINVIVYVASNITFGIQTCVCVLTHGSLSQLIWGKVLVFHQFYLLYTECPKNDANNV